ncbi:MAG: ATP-binding cassette domain-containing protein [Geminicoccaceae bacterium]|nr:ATP-binding cassette domain-containing protein [Geminicoccaceae bacterium]
MRYDGAAEVLHDITLTLKSGSFYFLTGPVGAGKTSLLRLLSLSHPAYRGTIRVFGRDFALVGREEAARLRQRIGVVFQDFRLLEHLSAFDNVALPLRIAGADDERVAASVPEMLRWLGLDAVMEAPPRQLSMGERQLVCIARAVVTRPALLLADEPTSNVDPERAERLMHLFVQLHGLGTSVVLSTHSQDLPRRHPFPGLRLEAGRLVAAA